MMNPALSNEDVEAQRSQSESPGAPNGGGELKFVAMIEEDRIENYK